MLKNYSSFNRTTFSELNILELEYVDPAKYSVKTIVPNKRNLGRKFKRNMPAIFSYLEQLPAGDLIALQKDDNFSNKRFQLSIEVPVVDSHMLETADFIVEQGVHFEIVNEIKSGYYNEIDHMLNENVLVIVDYGRSEAVISTYIARLFTKHIQGMRKSSDLHPWNKIKIYFSTDQRGNNVELCNAILHHKHSIEYNIGYEIKSCNKLQDLDSNKLEPLDTIYICAPLDFTGDKVVNGSIFENSKVMVFILRL